MPKNLDKFFSPKSIAVLGVSRKPEKVGAVIFKNLLDSGFKGEIYPVNPSAKEVFGVKCYKSLAEIPSSPDLVIMAIPSNLVLGALKEAGEKDVKNVVVISSGFKEIGSEGKKLEEDLVIIAKEYDINLLGPNCLGFVNNKNNINATFGKTVSLDGNMSFITQSGAIATSIFDWCNSVGLGFSDFVTLGNKAGLNESDMLEYFFEKKENEVSSLFDNTKDSAENTSQKIHPIGLYLESIVEGQRFIDISQKITKHNPVFILKPGKTSAASKAMQSHTGAIAGSDDVLNSVLKEAGVIRCQTLEDFFDLSKAFSWGVIPKGPGVIVISNAGGPAVISADSIIENGLEMAEIDEETKRKLTEILPASASVDNPVDVLGDALADRFVKTAEIILQSETCDSLLILLTPQLMTEIKKTAEEIVNLLKKYHKPIFCSFIGGSLVEEGKKILNAAKVPCFDFPERAIYALAKMWEFEKRRCTESLPPIDIYDALNFDLVPESVDKIIENALKREQPALDNIEASQVTSLVGIGTPPTAHVNTIDQALEFANIYDYPVVLKLSAPKLLHKKNVGGVITGIIDEKILRSAWNELSLRKGDLESSIKENVSIQIQKEIVGQAEVLVGIKRDEFFGPFILFGAGGSLAELISDRNIGFLPLDKNRAKRLVEKSKIYGVLKGKDGKPNFDLDELCEIMVRLGKIIEEEPRIEEMEINPLILSGEDIWAVDTKIILKDRSEEPKKIAFKSARTLDVKKLTEKMYYFDFKSEESMKIIPGQYISVKVSDTRVNCYSVAGFQSPDYFNLLVDITPGGPGSKFFEKLKIGDDINYLGPFGNFILKPNENVENVLFFATGCGVAPLKLMIETILADENEKRKIKLYLGVNNFSDVFFKDYFDELSKKHSNFSYQIAVSNPDPFWSGPTGFITELVKKDFLDASNCAAYLCGNKFMIEDVSKILMERGCPEERIYTEKYGK
jgi:acetyltransferase